MSSTPIGKKILLYPGREVMGGEENGSRGSRQGVGREQETQLRMKERQGEKIHSRVEQLLKTHKLKS